MPEPSSATITFLFTDVEGSTRLWEQYPDQTRRALARHDRLIEQLVSDYDGAVVRPRGEGDSRFAVFEHSDRAVAAACAIQCALLAESWPTPQPLRVRIAVHTGEAELREGDYYGSDVNRCARLRSIAHAGQIILSERTAEMARPLLAEGVSLRGLGQHRLKDLGQPEWVYQLVHPLLQVEFPPLKSLSSLLNNLPVQSTSFIGREREMAEVERMLRTTRLLTLTGAGGAGKTRLALQVVADVLDEFDDGVWFVELAPLSDDTLVVRSVAAALGLREQPARPLIESLIEALRPKLALLLLDNCEHLVRACAQLADTLLRACPHLRIMATSREALSIAGETTWRVPSLSVPDEATGRRTIQAVLRSEAAQLFVERAAAVRPGFRLTERDATAIAEVCRRLDGIPLAIELAAARVRVLAPNQIASRLADRFRLLTGGSRVAPTRQQTLRALVDWSYDLLPQPERVLFGRLAVFSGGLDLEAAEAVCVDEEIEAQSVLDLLSQLVDKSLLLAESKPGGAMRYRLLETLHQYALERLAELEGEDRFRQAHATYYLSLAETAEPQLQGRDQPVWLDRLEVDHDNLRAAFNTCQQHGEEQAQVRLASAIWRFWVSHGHLGEGRQLVERALQAAGSCPPGLRLRVLNAAAVLAREQGDHHSARVRFEESLVLSQESNDPANVAFALNGLGNVAWAQGEYAAAQVHYEAALDLRRGLGDKVNIAISLNNLGTLASDQGAYDAAWARHAESLELRRATGDQRGIAQSLQNLGEVALRRGDTKRAGDLYCESLVLFREMGERIYITRNLDALARVAAAAGQAHRAARLFGAAAALREATRAPLELTDHVSYQRSLSAVRGQLGEAVFTAAWEEGGGLPLTAAIEEALVDALAGSPT